MSQKFKLQNRSRAAVGAGGGSPGRSEKRQPELSIGKAPVFSKNAAAPGLISRSKRKSHNIKDSNLQNSQFIKQNDSSLNENSNLTSPDKRYIQTAKMSTSLQNQDALCLTQEQTLTIDPKAPITGQAQAPQVQQHPPANPIQIPKTASYNTRRKTNLSQYQTKQSYNKSIQNEYKFCSPKHIVSNPILIEFPHIHPLTGKVGKNQPLKVAHELELHNAAIGTLVGTQKLLNEHFGRTSQAKHSTNDRQALSCEQNIASTKSKYESKAQLNQLTTSKLLDDINLKQGEQMATADAAAAPIKKTGSKLYQNEQGKATKQLPDDKSFVEYRPNQTKMLTLSGQVQLSDEVQHSQPDSPSNTDNQSVTPAVQQRAPTRDQGTHAEGMEVHTEHSSPMQSSMKAKANLYLQAYETSTEEKAALFNDMKMMSQMAKQIDVNIQNPKTEEEQSFSNRHSNLNTQQDQASSQFKESHQLGKAEQIIISTDDIHAAAIMIPNKIKPPHAVKIQCTVTSGGEGFDSSASPFKNSERSQQSTQRQNNKKIFSGNDAHRSNIEQAQDLSDQFSQGKSIRSQVVNRTNQMQRRIQQQQRESHRYSNNSRDQVRRQIAFSHQGSLSGYTNSKNENYDNNQSGIGNNSEKQGYWTSGSMDQTMASEQISQHLDKGLLAQLTKSHNKILKSQTKRRQEMILDQMIQKKRQFAEVALKQSFVCGQRLPSAGIRHLEKKKECENAIQNLETTDFLKFINRNQKDTDIQKFIEQQENVETSRKQEREIDTDLKDLNENLVPVPVVTQKVIPLSTKQQYLNKYRFRKDFNILENQRLRNLKLSQNDFVNLIGISNYEYALKPKSSDRDFRMVQNQMLKTQKPVQSPPSLLQKPAHSDRIEFISQNNARNEIRIHDENQTQRGKSVNKIDSYNTSMMNRKLPMSAKHLTQPIREPIQRGQQGHRRQAEVSQKPHPEQSCEVFALTNSEQLHLESEGVDIQLKRKKKEEAIGKLFDELETNVEDALVGSLQTKQVEQANENMQMVSEELTRHTDKRGSSSGAAGNPAVSSRQNQAMELVKQQWRIVNQDCQRLLTASDEYPELQLGGQNGIFISKKQSLYYRIEVRGVPSPLKCEISYSNIPAKVSNLDIYFSTQCKEPNYKEHELRFRGNTPKFFLSSLKIGSNRQDKDEGQGRFGRQRSSGGNPLYEMRKKMKANNEAIFVDQYLYVGFTSDLQDINFSISISPMESRQNINKLKLELHKKQRQELLSNIDKVIRKDQYYEDMLQLVEEQRAFIQKHRNYLKEHGYGIYYQNSEKDAMKFNKHYQRLLQGKIRKQCIEFENRKMRLFQLVKWKHLREFKEEQLDISVAKFRRIKYRMMFIKLLRIHEYMKQINEIYLENKKERKKKIISFRLAIKYRCKFVAKIICRGKNVQERNRTLYSNIHRFYGRALVEVKSETAKETFAGFFREWIELQKMIKCFMKLIDVLAYMVRLLEKAHKTRRHQEHFIFDHLWPKKKSELIAILQHKMSTKEQKEINNKLVKISDTDVRKMCREGSDEYMKLPAQRKAKNFIISVYVMRMRKDAYLRFMRWFVAKEQYKGFLDPQWKEKNPKLQEYLDKIPKYVKMIEYLDDYLFKEAPDSVITWSERAKKDRKARLEALKKQKSSLFKDESEHGSEDHEDEHHEEGEHGCSHHEKQSEEEKQLVPNMPCFTLFKQDPCDYITETINGKDKKVNVCLRRMIVTAAKLTDEKVAAFHEKMEEFA